MNQERLHQILLRPIVSEKSTLCADKYQQIVFEVLDNATKPEIKTAVETLFNVKVDKVQVLNVRGKAKQFGRIQGFRKSWKKAYVRLQEGHDIDFIGMAGA